ncbi:MAG: hypothetical protein RIG68_15625 [Imperialibacter sp.]|uniref:hypothetical protein n=1 Tax=Imperialibacter sp. TaxID=2038411 RepID=UPI0032EF54BF
MKRLTSLLTLLLLGVPLLHAQDTITTVDGQTISAYILKEGVNFIYLGNSQYADQSNLRLRKSEIDSIQYQNGYARKFGNADDIRILRPYGVSAGLDVTSKNKYGNLYAKFDYFITPRINYEIHAGVSWAATGINYYFHKPNKDGSVFPYVGLLGGYDYSDYGSPMALIPVGVSKIFSNGLNIRLGINGALFFDHLESDVFGQVMLGYRFK